MGCVVASLFIVYACSAFKRMSEKPRSKQETLLLEERIEKIRKKNEEIKRRHLVGLLLFLLFVLELIESNKIKINKIIA